MSNEQEVQLMLLKYKQHLGKIFTEAQRRKIIDQIIKKLEPDQEQLNIKNIIQDLKESHNIKDLMGHYNRLKSIFMNQPKHEKIVTLIDEALSEELHFPDELTEKIFEHSYNLYRLIKTQTLAYNIRPVDASWSIN